MSPEPAAAETATLVERRFTRPGIHPYDEIDWDIRTAIIKRPDGTVKFEQRGVEAPAFWSQQATNIVAEKYFAYGLDDPRRESSVRQLIDRVVGRIVEEGANAGYFSAVDERDTFETELTYILLHQMAAFNSPVWFNVGKHNDDGSLIDEQCSACFLLAVEDDLDDIAEWIHEEGRIFKRGSGSGVNVSRLRGSMEKLSLGGNATGPVTFMRAADAFAGTIQSGGATRRAAKMVVCDDDHPDIFDFVWCKAREEERIRILAEAGVPIGLGSEEGEKNLAEATAYQNANNSVRLSDELMRAAEADEPWSTTARTTGEVISTFPARKLMREIADAAWRCADPGVQFSTTINEWHTTPAQGPITTSNPCGEYLSNDNSACNLASLNLLKFLRPDGSIDVDSYRHVARVIFTAQDITILFSSFPTEKIAENSRRLRQIGIGYANLGALLMALGFPYDSDEGRNIAAALTALLTGESYLQSSRIAELVGAFEHYHSTGTDAQGREISNREAMLRVIRKHRAAARKLRGAQPDLVRAAKAAWNQALERGEIHGYRNAQASVCAPTGTISFLMDCDTTGIEPDFALVKGKIMAGGGFMTMINKTLPRGLRALGYDAEQIDLIVRHVEEHGSVVDAPHVKPDHYPVFDVAVGERAISYQGHIRMMAAAQPFLSGAISKTVNLPETATVEDIENTYIEGWKLGLKAIAVYRDNCKHAQPLSDAKAKKVEDTVQELVADEDVRAQIIEELKQAAELRGQQRKMPRDGTAVHHHFRIGTMTGWLVVGLFEDGTPGNVMINTSQAGSQTSSLYKSWAQLFSYCLQFGIPLSFLVSKLAFTNFEPNGWTDKNAPMNGSAHSVIDYVVRFLAWRFLDLDDMDRDQLGLKPREDTPELPEAQVDERLSDIHPRVEIHSGVVPASGHGGDADKPASKLKLTVSGEGSCASCGGTIVRTGSCLACSSCGTPLGGCG